MEENKDNKLGGDDDEDEEEEEEISEQEKNSNLLLAAKQNRIDDVNFWLDKGAAMGYEEDGWNAILWASCNGNERLVRTLIKRGGLTNYMTPASKRVDEEKVAKVSFGGEDGEEEEEFDPFTKPLNAKISGRYTPLHWACYKGHYKVVWILLKHDSNVSDFDMYGNNAIH